MTIDMVSDLFHNLPQDRSRLTNLFRRDIFDFYSKSDEYGIIFTYMWAFDCQSDWDYMNELERLFLSRNSEVFFVELEANNTDLEPHIVASMIKENFNL